MKNFSPLKSEEKTHLPKFVDHSKPPQIICGSFENVKLEGANFGASMITRRGGCSGESPSINIYINNDTQGINNSILIGSDVKMGDPGVSLSLNDVEMDRGFQLNLSAFCFIISRLLAGLGFRGVLVMTNL
ncbi:unnamed protein product [Fraxinus pennsylvanica]|uniref:Uncharacterized protein n=1 Tax=Fraxinus pennsylvanica TaxID=56036 RepID=A0AAD1ZIW6_9LAMI|nr:unnamed protein product [Fraxinus pennsylvanica]